MADVDFEEYEMSWEEAWREGRTGWDTGESPPVLVKLLEEGKLGEPGRALVPGCGAGYDVSTLARHGWDVTGVDIAPTAVARFESLAGDHENARVTVGDFFELDLGEPFDLVWDYTFLCALPRDMRERWAVRMEEVVADDGILATLIFPVTESRSWDEGPPFRMSPDLVEHLLEGRFEAEVLRPVTKSHPGREGMEWIGLWRRC